MPFGSSRSSAVWTCVCVPTTAVTRPSRCHPIAIFSDVASAWKSTKMIRARSRSAFDLLLDHDERVVDVEHEHATHHVDDAHRCAAARAREVAAFAGRPGRVVRRPQQPRLGADVIERFLLVPDVIARRHHLDAPVEQLIADLAGDAEPRRGVLRVGDDEIDAVVLDEAGEPLPHELAARTADDVADEQQARAWLGVHLSHLPRRRR